VAQRSLLQHSAALEARVEQRTAELEASYRTLENATTELRTLIYGITHDLKTPFNSILLTIDLLLRRRGALLDEAIASELHAVAATARRGEAMLQDLLNAFRITSVHEDRRRIDLNALVAQAATVLQPQIIQRDVAVVSGRLPAVWGEARKMAHVIDNLLSNAVRHAPCATGLVEVTGTVDGGHVFLRVRDNGPGIPSEYHQRIFELFGRAPAADAASDVTSGTGVGLAVVKRIAEDHNGDVWVESSPGNGATFVVRLPAPSDDVPMT
jgi:signal transduction histidine kinase